MNAAENKISDILKRLLFLDDSQVDSIMDYPECVAIGGIASAAKEIAAITMRNIPDYPAGQGFQALSPVAQGGFILVRVLSHDEVVVANVLRAMSVKLDKLAGLAADGKLQEATAADYFEGV